MLPPCTVLLVYHGAIHGLYQIFTQNPAVIIQLVCDSSTNCSRALHPAFEACDIDTEACELIRYILVIK